MGYGDGAPAAVLSHEVQVVLLEICTLTDKLGHRDVIGADILLFALLGRTRPNADEDIAGFLSVAGADVYRPDFPRPDRPWLPASADSDDVRGLLLETYWGAYRRPYGGETPYWSVDVVNIVRGAVSRASDDGLPVVGRRQLLDVALAAPPPDVQVLLDRCDMPAFRLRSAIKKIDAFIGPESRYAPMVDLLLYGGGIPSTPNRPIAAAAKSVDAAAGRLGGSAVLAMLEYEAVRQAVRLAHPRTTTAHLMLAVASFYEQARLATDPQSLARFVVAGRALAVCGVTPHRAGRDVPLNVEPEPWATRRRSASAKRPVWTRTSNVAMDKAIRAVASRPVETHATHLLIAVLADPNAAATQMLNRMAIDIGYLSRAIARLET